MKQNKIRELAQREVPFEDIETLKKLHDDDSDDDDSDYADVEEDDDETWE